MKTSIAGIAGNVLEWYDFSVFGYFSDVIGHVFFPPDQKGHAALIESFAVFGGAFLVRPIGGAIFGHMGDTIGRKNALETSILLMAAPTFAMGCLPSYAAVGWLAPVLLICMRLLQGLSVGGQLMSSVVFTLERVDQRRWGIWGSSVYAAAGAGVSLGSLFSYILREALDDEQLRSWGWRLPFLLGAFGVLPGLYLRRSGEETPKEETQKEETQSRGALAEPFALDNRRNLLVAALLPCLPAATYYIVFIWLAVYMETIVSPPVPHAFMINTVVNVLSILLAFAGGALADYYGNYRALMTISAVCLAIVGPLFLHLIGNGHPGVAFACQAVFAILLYVWNGAMLPFMIKSFPPRVRLRSLSIGYNLALSICGGFSPFAATLLVDNFDNSTPGYVITVFALVSLLGLSIAPNQNDEPETDTQQALPPSTDLELT